MKNLRLMVWQAAILLVMAHTGNCGIRENKNSPTAGARKLFTLDYVNAEVRDVLRALSAQSGISLALNPSVKGQVTVHLHDCNVDEAVAVVAGLAGMGSKKVNGTYIVAPRAELRQTVERLGTSKSIAVTWIDSAAAIELAQANYPDITARPQGRGVVLAGAMEDIEGASLLIQRNDVSNPGTERVVQKVSLKYLPSAQAAATLARLSPGITADPAGDAVVLSGNRNLVEGAKHSLEMVDVPAGQGKEVKLYKVKYTSAAQLMDIVQKTVPQVQVYPGPDSFAPTKPVLNLLSGQFVGSAPGGGGGQSPSSSSGGAGGGASASPSGGGASPASSGVGTAVGPPPASLSLILQGPTEALLEAIKVLEMADQAPRQMMIEAKIVETNPSVAEEYGLKWNWTRFGFYEQKAGTAVDTGNTNGPGGDFASFVTKNNGPGVFSRVPWSFQGVLSAMITKRDAKLLASPQISVINDQDASIFIGDTLRFQALAAAGPNTGTQYTVVEVPVGIILLVHPRINDDGNITLRLHPVVSAVTALVNGLPQTSAREAETTVRVKDGDTLVIGGLIRDEDVKEMSKIPFIGDLPIIGHLFRNTNRNHRRTEVMVVLTVHLQK